MRSLIAVLCVLMAGHSLAASRILATSGLTQIEGAAGGGLVPWAVIGGYGSTGEWGAAASISRTVVNDFRLGTAAVTGGFDNRLELSFAQQTLQVENLAETLGTAPVDSVIEQHVFGAKARLFGDLIYGHWPQVSLGIQNKVNLNDGVGTFLGADRGYGTDYYVSASKLYLHALFERNLLLNTTFRYTDANQTGLLGFGNADGTDYQLMVEASAGLLLTPQWAIGGEYRQKPDRLDTEENDWFDAFVAWFPNKRIAVAAAWVDLGNIALWDDQQGWYLSVQITN
ncbi:MAG: DUF3034 family protein [Saccharospirillum sp.]